MSFFGIEGAFLSFSRKQQDGTVTFFSRFRAKQFFITTCIENQCTRPLNVFQFVIQCLTFVHHVTK